MEPSRDSVAAEQPTYVFPRAAITDPVEGQQLRVEVHSLAVDVPMRSMVALAVLDLSPECTLASLTTAICEVYGLDDLNHLAQLRIPADRRRHRNDRDRPARADDEVHLIFAAEDDEVEADTYTFVSELLGQGQWAYLLFDYGDEWWWSLHVAHAGPPTRPWDDVDTELVHAPIVQFEQYGSPE